MNDATVPSSLRRPRAVLFDLDGTLIDSHGAIAASVRHTLTAHEKPLPDEEAFQKALSFGLRELLAAVTGESDSSRIEAMASTYLDHYERTMIESSPPLPGVVAMLDGLLALGLPLSVLTNKTERNARKIVEAHFGPSRFRAIVGAVAGRPLKPDGTGARLAASLLGHAPEDAWLVGDSVVDLATAKNAGMHAIAATWAVRGHLREALASADLLFDAPYELLDYVAERA